MYDADFSAEGLAGVGPQIAAALTDVMDANKLAVGITLTSAGIPFMLSGEEFARTKFGSSDSYDSAKELNWLDWNRAWQKRDLIEYYAKLIALRKSDPQWFDGNRNIVDTEGDELVFRVGDYLMAANPGRHVGVIDVAVTGLEPIGGIRRYWCGLGSSVSPMEGNVSAGDGDYYDCSTAYVCNLAVAVIPSVGKLQNGDRKAAVAVTDTAMGPENQKGYDSGNRSAQSAVRGGVFRPVRNADRHSYR